MVIKLSKFTDLPFFKIADLVIRSKFPDLFIYSRPLFRLVPIISRIQSVSPSLFPAGSVSMQRSFAHQDPQFAVNAKFESFSALKHACTRAALTDVYEFVPENVKPGRYTLKCKEKTCGWRLHATSIGETDTWQIRTSIQTHSCHGINHSGNSNIDEEFISIEILPQVRSDSFIKPKSIQNYFKDHYGVEISGV